MLYPARGKSPSITSVTRLDNCLYLRSELGTHRIAPISDSAIRITFTPYEEFSVAEKIGVILKTPISDWTHDETDCCVTLKTDKISLFINKATSAISYYDACGKLLLSEREKEPKITQEFTKYRLKNIEVEEINTADGTKKSVKSASREEDGKALHSWVHFVWQNDEELYGLGQHEEGFGSLRGQTVYVHQGNRKVAIPFMVSTLGYGILMDTYSPMIFCDTPHGSYIYSEAVDEIDYYFVYGSDMNGAVKEYRKLTGKASMLPKWAFGYVQSKERYETQEEILSAAKEYRERGIGLDCIVLDWISWEGNKWGQKSFDKSRFPDATKMIDTLHEQNVKFMISVWPSMSSGGENRAEFDEVGHILPACDFYDVFNADARKLYWKQASEGLFTHGVDAWWTDNCEPFAPEWETIYRPEPSKLINMYFEQSSARMPAEMTNAYALYHCMGVYEGQRSECDTKRVVSLARSGYTGQQRYGSILWSGDIAATWDTLRRQVAAGLGFSASGLPYWTVDIGAFFIKNGLHWYWKGDYDNTVNDPDYRELFLRWYQWGAFLPVFRGHGTDCNRELWNFGDKGDPVYDALCRANKLRYELMPYIYSLAGRAWCDDESIIRYLAFDYPSDKTACSITDQYMFGDSIMVCPIVESDKKTGSKRKIYLPTGGWYDMNSNKYYEGSCWIELDTVLDEIPLFVKAGAVIPRAEYALSTAEQSKDLTVYVYAGADGSFKLYDDSGDGYAYENGEYETCELIWNDSEKTLSFTNEEMLKGRNIKINVINNG